jgi:hypothetical protein
LRLVAPDVLDEHIQLHGALVEHAGVDVLEPMVVPAQHQRAGVHRVGRTEVPVAAGRPHGHPMWPGTDHQLAVGARLRGGAALEDPGVVAERADGEASTEPTRWSAGVRIHWYCWLTSIGRQILTATEHGPA